MSDLKSDTVAQIVSNLKLIKFFMTRQTCDRCREGLVMGDSSFIISWLYVHILSVIIRFHMNYIG